MNRQCADMVKPAASSFEWPGDWIDFVGGIDEEIGK